MKLHLPKMLAVALLSACAAISANADVPYTGSVYTWDNTTSGSDPAFGNYAKTTYDEQGNPTVTDEVISGRSGNWGNVQAIFASDAIQTGNTLRFDSEHGQSVKTLNYTFSPFTVGGIIVEEGATGFTINSGGTNNRAFFLGNKDGSASYNEIHEDFAINKTTGGLTLTLRGEETMEVASGKTFTLKSNRDIAMTGSLTVTGEGTVDFAQGNAAMASDFTLEVQQGATLKFAGAVTGLSNTITNNGTINFGSTVAVGSFDGFDGTVVYSAGNNGFVTSAEYTLIEGTGTSNLTAIQHGTTTLTVTDNKVNVDEADYSTYYLNDDAATVSIAAAAGEAQSHEGTLANIVVKGADTGITSDSNGMLLNSLSLGAGADTTVSGTEQLTVGAVTFGAGSKLALAEDASVKVLTKPTFTTGSQVTVAEGSVLDLSSYSSNPDAIEAIAANVTGAGSVKIAATGELSFSENGTTTVLTALEGFSDAEFNGKGWVAGSYGHIFNIGDGSRTGSIKAAGTLRLESKVHVNVNQGSSLVVDGTLAMGHKQAGNPGHLVVNGGTLTVGHILLQDDTTANTFSLTNATVEVTQAGDVFTGTGAATAVTTSGLLVKNLSDGDITWNHASDYAGGDLAVDANGHTITLGVAGGTSTLHNTIEVKDGDTVGFAGTWDVSHLAGDAQPTYKDGVTDGNGYATLEIAVQLATGTITAESDAATFIIKGVAGTLDHATGKVTTSSEPDYATYFLNENFETYSDIIEVAAQHQELTGGIVVAEDAVLLTDADMSMSVVAASSKGTVDIDGGVVVTAAGGTQAVQITGSGIYALAANTQTLGSVKADDFGGYVRLSGTVNDINLDGNLGSTNVEFKGLSGYFKNLAEGTDDTYSGNIHLVNDGDTPALKITNGYSRTESEYIFAGDISGDGTWELAVPATQHYVFTGDLYDWTGEFKVTNSGSNNGGTSLAFRENATNVYAAITRNGGTLKLIVENGATFRKDVTGATSLTVTEGNMATFEGTTSIGSLIGAGEVQMYGNLTLTGTTTSEADGDTNFTGMLYMLDDATLTVNGNVDLGGHLQADGDRVITVGDTGSLSLTGESHIGSQTIQNSGTVTLSGVVVDGIGTHVGEEAHFDLAGRVTGSSNYYDGVTGEYVQVVNGGTSSGTVIWQGDTFDLQGNGRAVVGEDDVDYSTFYVNDGTVKISDIANSGHDTTTVEVASGTLDVDQAGSGIEINVTGEATVTGEGLDASQVGIESEAMANFGETLKLGGVEFSSTGPGVAVYNAGEDAEAYSLQSANMVVSATGITKTIGEDVIVSNWLTVEEITNEAGGTLTLNGMEDAVEVANITVGTDSAVEILSAPETEATITVTEELAAGGGTLLANLVMAEDSALLVNGVQKALSIGSVLTMNTNIALDEATLRALDTMAVGETFVLIGAVDGKPMEYYGESGDDAWYGSVFSRTAYDSGYELNGDFNIVFNETDGFGLQKFSSVPEPTTGTLSLLALMALAARRRKH